MKKLIAFCVVIIVAVITNPKKDDHVDAVKKKMSQAALAAAVEGSRSGNDFEKAGAVIGMTLGMTVIDNMIESVLEVNNYLLFSLTKFSYARTKENTCCRHRKGNLFGLHTRLRFFSITNNRDWLIPAIYLYAEQ